VAGFGMARRPSAPRPGSGPTPIAREFGNARRVAGKAQKIISRVFIEARLGKVPRVADVAPVVEDIFASIQRNPYAFSGLMRCKAESEAAYHHMLSVSALMVSLARQMRLPPGEMRLAGMAGLLLDIGLSRVETGLDSVARAATGAIEDAELLGRHCLVGRDMLAAAGDVPDEVLHVVMRHHERLDASGYPQALVAQDLDIFSRMAAICDTYDLIVSGAASGRAIDPAEAMHTLMGLHTALDEDILARFKEALGVYPVGSFVELRSRRIALVVDQSPSDPDLPTVRAFYSLETGKHIQGQTIALAQCFGEDGILGVADLDALDLPPAEDLREALLSGKERTDQIPYQNTSVVESAATMINTNGTPERR
ncbi:HD domain-containing protein, partial [Novosphingobium sp. 1949]